jgi:hypothetical protein
MILNAERIYIIGYGASAFLAGLMAHSLDPFCNTVQSTIGTGGPSTVARQLFKYTSRDLVIGISFPRYAEDAVTILRQLNEKKYRYWHSLMRQAHHWLHWQISLCMHSTDRRHFHQTLKVPHSA